MTNAFDKLAEARAAYKAECKKVGKFAITELFADFFRQFPEVKALAWSQYTPHFNDGDPCTFRVNDIGRIWFSGEDADEDGVDSYDDAVTDAVRKVLRKIDYVLSHNEDALAEMFGDGYLVKVSRDGLEIEEYDHD